MRTVPGSDRTDLSATSLGLSGEDDLEDAIRGRQVLEHGVRPARGQVGHAVGAGGDGDRAGGDREAAVYVRGCVADDDDLGTAGLPAKQGGGPSRGDRGKLGTM